MARATLFRDPPPLLLTEVASNVPNLSAAGNQFVQDLAQRHGVSPEAATHMLIAVHNGNGSMAQFNHPEFGGSGQWMRGGMTMVSDLFNHQLKSRVNNICGDIANGLANHQLIPFSGSFQSQSQNGSSTQSQAGGQLGSQNSLFVADAATNWWPRDLGPPSAVGSQNNVRYAYFPSSRRLAVATGGETWVYDTQDHQIGGFSQQQGRVGSIAFSSQFGTVDLATLPVVSRDGVPQQIPAGPRESTSAAAPASTNGPVAGPDVQSITSPAQQEDVLATLERLGALKEKGYVTEEEFNAKKAELLSRL